MTANKKTGYGKLGLGICLVIGGVLFISRGNCALAEITPDNTLPNNSRVKVEGNKRIVEGGTTRSGNLFHSFKEFSVTTGSEAHFNNATNIENIISRVTGKSISDIDGLIKANGNANLFLINPNGIIFGENARLDIGGSFVGSTANSLKFSDGKEFSAKTPQAKPLLTINVPTGLQYGKNPGSIQVRGDGQGIRQTSELVDTQAGLRVGENQTLAMVGGDINLEGATLKTAGGRIELGSVAGESLVNLNPTQKGFSLGYDAVENGGNIQLSEQAVVDASGEGGGDIQVWGKGVTITDGSQIEASTLGSKNGGNLTVNAQDVQVIGRSKDTLFPSGLGVQANSVGDAGDLSIKANTLLVKDGALVSASTFAAGKGGNLTIDAQDVQLIGTSKDGRFVSTLSASADQNSTGDARNLTIKTNTLLVKEGAQVSVITLGKGNGGNLTIEAQDVQVIGKNKDAQFPTGLFTQTARDSTGDAGNLTIKTNTLLVIDLARVSTGTSGEGKGGNLTVNAQDVQLIGTRKDDRFSSGLFTQATSDSTVNAGDLKLTTDRLLVNNYARISARNLGKGIAGKLEINANSVQFNNGTITATTRSGNGGNITLNIADLLVMRNDSIISTNAGTAQRGGNGGNITINTPNGFIAASPNQNNDITANAFEGSGGRVNINATGIFGIAPLSFEELSRLRPNDLEARELLTNDITAVSQQNPDLSGSVEIDALEDTPEEQEELPTDIVDASRLIEQNLCQASQDSEFIITGRGGIPQSPRETLETDAGWEDWRVVPFKEQTTRRITPKVSKPRVKIKENPPEKIVLAQGVTFNSNGEVVLTATPNTAEPFNSGLNALNCHNFGK